MQYHNGLALPYRNSAKRQSQYGLSPDASLIAHASSRRAIAVGIAGDGGGDVSGIARPRAAAEHGIGPPGRAAPGRAAPPSAPPSAPTTALPSAPPSPPARAGAMIDPMAHPRAGAVR